MDRLTRIAYGVVLLAPASAILYLVLRYGVNIPYWDQWDFVSYFVALENRSLSWADLFPLHNEHRMVFPKLVMLVLGALTHWNVRAELVVSFILALATLLVLMTLMRPVLKGSVRWERLWAALATSLMLFSWAQWENWLWGWQIQWFLAVFAAVSSIALATWSLNSSRSWAFVAGSAAAVIVCQFSIASGAALWPAIGLILFFHPDRRRVLILWTIVAVAVIAFYLNGYARPPHHPTLWSAFEQPGAFVRYLGNYLSGPLGRHAFVGLASFVAFVVLGGVAVIRHWREPVLALPWIALGGFAVANAILTGLGRVGFGAEQGLASRYVTIALLLSISLVPLGLLAYRAWPLPHPLKRYAGIGIAAVVLVLVVRIDVRNHSGFVLQGAQFKAGRDCVLAIDDATDDCLKKLYPVASTVRMRAAQLHTLEWSGFQGGQAPMRRTLALTGPNGEKTWHLNTAYAPAGWLDTAIIEDGAVVVSGWARHPAGNTGFVRRVLVVADSSVVAEAEINSDRPDVAAHFKDPTAARSGWRSRIPTRVPAGQPLKFQAYLILDEDTLVPIGGEATIPSSP